METNNNISFNCESCNFSTTNKYDYKKHLSTKKHLKKNNKYKNNIESVKNYRNRSILINKEFDFDCSQPSALV